MMFRPRFSLRAMAITLTILSLSVGGIVERRNRHQSAMKRIVVAGGSFENLVSEPIGPNFLWRWNSVSNAPAPSVGIFFSRAFERMACVTAGRQLCLRDQHDSEVLNEIHNLFLLRSLTLVRSMSPRFPRQLELVRLIEIEWDNNLCDSLSRIEKLEYFYIVNCAVPERDLLILAEKHKALKDLGLYGVALSETTLNKIRVALPKCRINHTTICDDPVELSYLPFFPSMASEQGTMSPEPEF